MSNYALTEFMISRNIGLAKSQDHELWKTEFQLFKESVDYIPWETVLRYRGADQSWHLFKDICLRAQEVSVTVYWKSSKAG